MAFKSFFNWSGGKDGALALYHILNNKNYSVERLLTNMSGQYHRISMHGVREVLLEQQADAIGIPLQKIILPDEPSMNEYEEQMIKTMNQLQHQNFTHSVFGDIFLEDLKRYRKEQLAKMQMEAIFPLWKRDSTELIHEFIDLGFKTIVVCVNEKYLDKSFCGRIIDQDFINDLPPGVDACGENGEFHTFVFDGPLFSRPVIFTKGEIVSRKYTAPKQSNTNCVQQSETNDYNFFFCDLLPA
ncbi:MAG: diphthine--ammonia ligase [Ginsengibacter sp.]